MPDNPVKPPLRDRIIPWYFVMAFAVVMAVNAWFVYLATSTRPDTVTQRAYEKGLDYVRIVQKTRHYKERVAQQQRVNKTP